MVVVIIFPVSLSAAPAQVGTAPGSTLLLIGSFRGWSMASALQGWPLAELDA